MNAEQAISRDAYYNGSKCLPLFLSFNEGLKGRGGERELEKQIVLSVMATITERVLMIRSNQKNRMQLHIPPPDAYKRRAILTFLDERCAGCLLGLCWLIWFRRIISYH